MKSDAKKLVIVFNNLNFGGIETKIVDLCQYYSKQKNIRIFLLLKNCSGSLLKLIPNNVSIVSPQITNLLKIKNLYFPFWLSHQFTTIKPDLIVSFGNYSSISTIIAKKISNTTSKTIISEDSSIIEQIDNESFSNIRKILVKITYPLSDLIIALTQTGKNKLKALIPNIKNTQLTILPNWLPLRFKEQKKVRLRSIDILFLGRFEPQKNPLEFLLISKVLIKQNPDLKIAMVGYGSLESQIEKSINNYHLQKNIYIYPATINPSYYYRRAKIFLQTSIHEGFPLTILEASASGCIPICHQLSEIKSFFTYQSSLLLYNNTSSAIRHTQKLISQPHLCQNISQRYQEKVFKNQRSNFQNTIQLFQKYL